MVIHQNLSAWGIFEVPYCASEFAQNNKVTKADNLNY